MEFELDAETPAASSLLSLQPLPLSIPHKSYCCPISDCRQVFPSKKELNGHKVMAHEFVRCSAKRCSKIFMSERKREIHLAKCHRDTKEDKPAPTVLTEAQNPVKIALEPGLIGDLEGATIDYLGSIKRLATTDGIFNAQRFQALAMYILNELVGGTSAGSVATQSFLLHALDVARGMPATVQIERKGGNGQEGLGDVRGMQTGSQGDLTSSEKSISAVTISPNPKPFQVQSFSSSKHPSKKRSSKSPQRRGPKPQSYACTKCSQVFPFKKELQAHRHLAHPGRRPAPFSVQQLPLAPPALPVYQCSEAGCQQSFQTETGLTCHFLEKHSS